MKCWVLDLAKSGITTSKNFEQGLGRLGFSALALVWERPFLGPLYSWSSAVRTKKGALRIPAMLRAILMFLATRFGDGGELQEAPPLRSDVTVGEDLIFYTDAKATDSGAWIGGFKQDATGRVLEWFSEEIGDWVQKGSKEGHSNS